MSKLKKIFAILFFPYIYLMLALIIPTNYSVTSPYGIKSTNDMILIEGSNTTNNLYSVSVLSTNQITAFGRMIYELNPRMSVEEISPYIRQLTLTENSRRGIIQKQASFEQSIITAFTLANEVDSTISIDYDYLGMIIDYRERKYTNLEIGDLIMEIDGKKFVDHASMLSYFNSKQEMYLKIKRFEKIIDVNFVKENNPVFSFYPKYEIKNSSPKFTIPGQSVLISGPSAGMMYTLSVYFSLINYDKIDEIIVGTGTIRHDFLVGRIGGLEQKIYGALDQGAKHFILPKSQYDEVKHLSSKINMYQVENIYEAIEVIYEIFE
ncbi:S16 family serine protease [Acholeplasma hippikon]|uniref:Predicted secreted protein containing a PDZ domain n=1 Tax=Acholeplasma hippikon TaxID=264636 RepID=A0A449BJ89_9MOLU|nr:S16 family serine protease [Acholeplasma hippikon]VEU82508.1 Predicted secreted protein containing a PDZ domain [Acholeplasma hippikon]